MSGIQIMGLAEQPIEGVHLENIHLTTRGGGTSADAKIDPKELGSEYPEPGKIGTLPAYGLYARHASHLELSNLSFSSSAPDERSAVVFEDVKGLEIDHVTAKVGTGIRAVIFSSTVHEVVIRNSPEFERLLPGRN